MFLKAIAFGDYYLLLMVMKTWAGGGAGLWPAPPAATVRFMAPQATGVSNTRLDFKKNMKYYIMSDFV